jgi:hypothetical protein
MKFDLIDPGLKLQFVPDSNGLEKAFQLGRKIGQALQKD